MHQIELRIFYHMQKFFRVQMGAWPKWPNGKYAYGEIQSPFGHGNCVESHVDSPAITEAIMSVGRGHHPITRNTLDCDQSNYSSRIVYSHIPIAFGQTGISAVRSADPENPNLLPRTKHEVDRTTSCGDMAI